MQTFGSSKAKMTAFSASTGRGKFLLAATFCVLVFVVFTFRSDLAETRVWKSASGVNTDVSDSKTTQAAEAEKATPTPTSNSKDAKPTTPTETAEPEATETLDPCYGFPDTSDILVVMKTGATEAYEKLPIHFMSTLKCANDSLLISDMEMDMAGHHLVDVLSDFPQSLQDGNDDFKLYRTLKEYKKLRQDPRTLKADGNGWNLDKYKFIPMLQRTWKYNPDAAWYVFVEADTGVNWDNLRTYLNTLNPKDKYYIGSPTYLDIEFAHGGTGYVISNGAMKEAVGKHLEEIGDKYNKDVQDICCGDRMIARVLLDQGIKLTRAWPMFNGEKPITLPFGTNQWCQPFITMHHMTAQEVSQVWNFEQQRKKKGLKQPMLWKDIYNHFIKPVLTPTRTDWDNLTWDTMYTTNPSHTPGGRQWHELSPLEQTAGENPDNCRKMCDADDNCLQWQHKKNECHIGYSVKFGNAKLPAKEEGWDEEVVYTSGWRFERIGRFREGMRECVGGVDWSTQG